MTITLIQNVKFDDEDINNWHKKYESNVIPFIGAKICDPLWKDPYEYEVTEVIIDYYSDECTVYLKMYEGVIYAKDRSLMKKTANLHGWEVDLSWK